MTRCERCGSVGSIEFGMCQVCLAEYPDNRLSGYGPYGDTYHPLETGRREEEGVLVGTS